MNPVFANLPVTVFEAMSQLARDNDAINLGQGFPDAPGPEDVRRAAADAVINGYNQYPSMMGIPELRQAIAAHYAHWHRLSLDPMTEVMVTSGGTEALTSSILAVVEPGDEVVVFQPVYDSYLPIIRQAGGIPRLVRLEPPHWRLTEEALAAVFNRKTKAVLFLRATVLAAQAVPEMNGTWKDEFVASAGVDLGVAVATRSGGLVTPRIMDAQKLDLGGLMAQLTDLVKRAKAGRLKASELQPGSITVSSLADNGPDLLYGVIYPPQVALVGVGGVGPRPFVVDGELAVRTTATVTVSADHRATDGRTGARFLTAFGKALTHPEEL